MLQQLIANGLIQGAEIALLAVGFSVLYSASRFFVFTYGASFVWAAYSFLWFAKNLRLCLAAALGTLVSVTLGVCLERGIYRHLREHGRSPLVLMLASIGAYVMFQNIISLSFGDVTRLIGGWGQSNSHSWLGIRFTGTQVLIVTISFVAIVFTSLLLALSPLGKHIRAVANDPTLAFVVGIDVNLATAMAVAIGSALAGVGAVLVSLDLGLTPIMGFQALLLGVVAAIVGGVGSIGGAALGGVTLGLLQELAVWKLPSQWQEAVVFAALIVVLIVRPQGFISKARQGAFV
jgi:branched-chain amino acid transport system permease protein